MNHQTKRARYAELIKPYIDYLPKCSFDEQMNLLAEINNLKLMIERIDQMPTSISKNQITEYYITLESKINHEP